MSSYNHNKAAAMKEFIKQNGAGLTDRVEKELELRSKYFQYLYNDSDHETSLFLNTQQNFYFALQNLMYNVGKILPDSTVSIIRVAKGREKQIKNLHGKNICDQTIHKLSGNMPEFDNYFSQNLTGIFSIIRSHAMVDGLEKLDPDEKAALLESPCFMGAVTTQSQTQASYQQLFRGVTNNIKNLQRIRKKMGLPIEIFDGEDIEKQMLSALELYTQSRIKILEIDNEEPSKTLQEPDHHDDAIIYDTDYFKRMHEYHQKLKQSQNKSSKHNQQETFSDFELELYQFMNEVIYHPVHRPTWNGLITDLDYFGFSGEPNRSGNGSTWVFSVTDKNELFYNDDYRQATFNVHEFKGNEPIHPKYLKFFQSGLSNVFGLTENYITEALKKHAAQAKKN